MADDLDKLEAPAKGHNRVAGIDGSLLKSFVERWENLQDEVDDAREGQKSIIAAAKDAGLDTKTLRKVLTIRRKPMVEYQAALEATENYLLALGLL